MKAQIYRLSCLKTGKYYIGSTTHTLNYRLKKHRSASKEEHRKNSPLYTHFREVGWENADMSTLFEVIVETRRELFNIEKNEILNHINSDLCLNYNRPLITQDEKKLRDAEYGKQRREFNPERERERIKEWRKNNPDKYREQRRRYINRRNNRYLQLSSVDSPKN